MMSAQATPTLVSQLVQGLSHRLQVATFPPKWEWFTGLTCLLTLLFLTLLPMLPVELPNLWYWVLPRSFSFGFDITIPKTIHYTFQWWAMAGILSCFGIRLGSFIMALWLMLSFFLPVFAEGGGLSVWQTLSMPYYLAGILAFMVLAQKWQFLLKYTYERSYERSFSRSSLPSSMRKNKRSPLRLFFNGLLLALWSVLFFHCVGGLGLLVWVLFQQYSPYEALQWGLHHTVYPLPYDFLGVLWMLIFTRPLRLFLRPLLYGRLIQRANPMEHP